MLIFYDLLQIYLNKNMCANCACMPSFNFGLPVVSEQSRGE